MAVTIERSGAKVTITIPGDFTAPGVPELQAALKKELEQGARELTFDLAATSVLDSSGIGLMVAACNSLARVQGMIRVVNVSQDIQQLLQSMRLVRRLNVSGRFQ